MPSFIFTGNELSIVIDNTPYTVERDHPKFSEIVSAVKEGRWDEIPELISVAKALQFFGEGKVEVDEDEGVIRYEGRVLNNVLTNRILWMMNDGFNIDPFVKFVENLMSNPSKRAVEELYTFLEYGKLPITEDGCFLAYKRIGGNYKDIHSGTVLNKPYSLMTEDEKNSLPYTTKLGVTVECGDDGETTISMPRNKVDDRSEVTCSEGLHFCSLEYLKSFSGERIVILKINPRDVVSIPTDYNNTKGRCCGYEVVGEYLGSMTDPAFTKSVVNSDGSELEPEDDNDSNNGYIDGYDAYRRDDVEYDISDLNDAQRHGHSNAEYIRQYLEGVAVAASEGDCGEVFDSKSQDYIEGYVKGHKDGRKRDYPEIEPQNLADGEPYEGDDYAQGYVDGYKDGKGHKARRYTE